MFTIFGFVFGLVVGAILAIPCNWIFRVLLRPLEVPPALKREYKRERMMTFLIFIYLTMSYLGDLFILCPILCVYLIGIYRHFRERKLVAAGAVPLTLPRIPQIALSELIAMVIMLAMLPLIIGQIITLANAHLSSHPVDPEGLRAITVIVYVAGVLIFPLCFASAYHRLDGNRVPRGWTRMAFLLLYPYFLIALHTFFYFVIECVIMVWVITPDVANVSIYAIAPAIAVLALGIYLASRAKVEAQRAEQTCVETAKGDAHYEENTQV